MPSAADTEAKAQRERAATLGTERDAAQAARQGSSGQGCLGYLPRNSRRTSG